HELDQVDARASDSLSGERHTPMSSPDINGNTQQMPSDVIDPSLDRRTKRKLDFILLPFLALLFLFNSLDKSNIGNAETANFTSDIGIDKSDLNTAVAIFFACFVGLQPVGAALGRRYGMSIWVPGCMSVWGVCTALHVWVRTKWQLIVLRMVIGALEGILAGFYPVTVSYLSLFYTKFEFGRRLAVFYGQSAIAGAFGGILSYFVFSWFPNNGANPGTKESNGWKSWQVLFFVEGATTIVIALTGFFWLPHSAKTAWFLSPDERVWAEERIKADQSNISSQRQPKLDPEADGENTDQLPPSDSEAAGLLASSADEQATHPSPAHAVTDDRGLSRHDILSAFLDWKVWYLLACNILSAIPVSAFSVFLPLILAPLTNRPANPGDLTGFQQAKNPALTNLLTAPPFLLGAVVLYVFTSYSDRHRIRLYPILVGLGILLFGLTLTVFLPRSWVIPRYVALCILLSGSFIASPLQVTWLSNNIPQPGKRSVVLGINGWGNLAGVFSAMLFKPRFAPSYEVPFFVTFACVAIAWAGYAFF
ncbi:MFS general substrate transporter, partial [Rhizodiscina lignyota]